MLVSADSSGSVLKLWSGCTDRQRAALTDVCPGSALEEPAQDLPSPATLSLRSGVKSVITLAVAEQTFKRCGLLTLALSVALAGSSFSVAASCALSQLYWQHGSLGSGLFLFHGRLGGNVL